MIRIRKGNRSRKLLAPDSRLGELRPITLFEKDGQVGFGPGRDPGKIVVHRLFSFRLTFCRISQ